MSPPTPGVTFRETMNDYRAVNHGNTTDQAEQAQVADAQSLAALELDQLLARLAELAISPLGAELCRRLRPGGDPSAVARRQRRLAQLRAMVAEDGRPQLDGLEDIRPFMTRLAVDGAYLVPLELAVMGDFLGAVGRAAAFLDPAEERFDEVFRLRNRITPLPDLARRIRSIIGPGNTVSSQASPELARVRRELNRAREALTSQLMGMVSQPGLTGAFSDQLVTQRADRYVVPVRTDAKGRVPGIIHDTSGSGHTCFVEPLEAIESNNHLSLLRRKEREEEERVLRVAARDLAGQLQSLGENLSALAKLDCLLAQTRLADLLDCHEPALNTEGVIDLERVRHPLLAWRQAQGRGRAVPINVRLDPAAPVLMISGANAGGKTVTLKTVGLVTLMAMCGLAVPAATGSRLAVWGQVLAEIGDEQDLDRELSTFTAHAGRLAHMVRRAGRGSLCLIDELGNGTDPGEGAALGMAVLDWLADKGAAVICTTHFHRLKAYAARTPGAVNVSVAFDAASGVPTYQLRYGTPGFSDALAVSRRLGFPPQLLERAAANLDQGEKQTVALLQDAERIRQQAGELARQAQADRLAAREEREEAKRLAAAARRERAGALAEGKRRVREVAKRLEGKLEQILEVAREAKEAGRPVKPGSVKQELYQARRQALEQVDQAVTPPEESAGTQPKQDFRRIKAGELVEVESLGQSGRLLEELAPGMDSVPVSIGVGGVRVMVKPRDLRPLGQAGPPPPEPGRGAVSVRASAGDGVDLKILGLTVDEALPLVEKAIDQAILAGRAQVSVVHGVGTGRLRNAVRQYLERHPMVAATHAAERRAGGAGVTVAELRD